MERKITRVYRDDKGHISHAVSQELPVPSFKGDDGDEIALSEVAGFVVSLGGPDPDGTIHATHNRLFPSEQEADEHIARMEAAARAKGYLGLQACVYAIPRELDLVIEPRVHAVGELEVRPSSNGKIDFGFRGSLQDDPPGL